VRKNILILGGYGNLGLPVARYLAKKDRDYHIILAGRDLQKAERASVIIKTETGFQSISGQKVDASDPESLDGALSGADMVIVASSTLKYVENVASAAIKAGADYFDAQLSSPSKLDYLRKIEPKIKSSGRIFITDGGFHPGLLAAIVRWAEIKLGPLTRAEIFGALKLDWAGLDASKETLIEMIDEFKSYDMSILKEGKWVKPGLTYSRRFDFKDPFHKQECVPMLIEEMRFLPESMPQLKESGFYVTGFNWVFDTLVLPLMMLCLHMNLKSLAVRLFRFGLSFSRPPYLVKLVADCQGENGKLSITFTDIDGYKLTTIPMVACLNQYLEGNINKPGLYWQAWVVEPERFFEDMEEMGLEILVEYEES
jgi:saccharopine dehydrogenase (NAD+, L-lysine-forming)